MTTPRRRLPSRITSVAVAGLAVMVLQDVARQATATPLYYATSSTLNEVTPSAATNPASSGTTVTNQINGGFAVTASGVIYTNNGGTIVKLASDGTVLNSSLVTGLTNAQELMAEGEDFWVVRNSPLQATRYNSSGTLQQTINLSVMSTASRAMSVDSLGNYYFINSNQIFKYTAAGNWSGLFTTITGETLFDIAIDSADNIMVTSSSLGRVYKTNTSLSTPTQYVTGLSTPRGLAFDDQDNLYVLNSAANQINLFNSSGTLVESNYVFGITPSGGGTWLTVAPVPEPSTLAVIGLGLAGLAVATRRRRA
jgi:hypothetical protein